MTIRHSIGFFSSQGSGYDADLNTYITGLATPLSSGQLTLLNTFILSVKSGLSITNLSDAFDCMYILAGETAESSLRNLVSRNYDATAVNSPNFTALEGYKGDAISMALNLNYIPSTNGLRYTLNNSGYGCYNRYNRANSSTKYAQGVIGTTSTWRAIQSLRSASTTSFACLNATSGTTLTIGANSSGFYGMNRTASNVTRYLKNTIYALDDTDAAVALPNKKWYALCYNNNDTAAGFTDDQLSLIYIGRALSDAEYLALLNAFETYMDANGKGIL